MVGDGVNDAAALAQADLGIAVGARHATRRSQASDLTLVRGDLRLAADAIRLARATLRTIKGNLAWAFGYNVAALPLAAAGFLNPMMAGAAMALSSVFVVTNSLRLLRFRPRYVGVAGAPAADGEGDRGGDHAQRGAGRTRRWCTRRWCRGSTPADGGGDRGADLVRGEDPAEDDDPVGCRRPRGTARRSAARWRPSPGRRR